MYVYLMIYFQLRGDDTLRAIKYTYGGLVYEN